MDKKYGSPHKAKAFRGVGHERTRTPISLCELDTEVGSVMATIVRTADHRLFRGVITSAVILWAMNRAGEIRLAIEEIAKVKKTEYFDGVPLPRRIKARELSAKKLGHPSLHGVGEQVRIAGQIYVDVVRGYQKPVWVLDGNSGRFSYEDTSKQVSYIPTKPQLDNVSSLFSKEIGEQVIVDSKEQYPVGISAGGI